ncbi:MAG: Hsp20/alpha crystallin family protein [Desulfobacterales bacterium]|nr:Hsp20/alpha crystallin family protein [Desulfobacterales bacterium]
MFNLVPCKKQENEKNEIARFKNELNNLFDSFFKWDFPERARELLSGSGIHPAIDVIEGKKEITVKAEIPGMEKDDIEILLDGRNLTIKGVRKQEKEDKGENYHRVELSYGSFARTIELPAEVDEKDVSASYKKGILKIDLKKTKEGTFKKIEIKTE